jgi:transposase-like protein
MKLRDDHHTHRSTMITETHTYSCGKCGSTNIVRNGINRSGNQQYLCKDCHTCRVLSPKSVAYSAERREELLALYQERSSMRGVERATGVSRHTLAAWIKQSRSLANDRGNTASVNAG